MIWLRGGIIGSLSLTLNERVVDWMEINREELTRKRSSSELLDFNNAQSQVSNKVVEKKMDDFVYSVHDKSQLLYRLAYLGYFDINEKKLENDKSIGRTFENINILLGSIFSSMVISACLTPLDIVAMRHKFLKSCLNTSIP